MSRQSVNWDNFRWHNVYVIGVPEGEERQKEQKKTFER